MKNKLYLLSVLSIFVIAGCKGNTSTSSSKPTPTSSSSRSEVITSTSSSLKADEANILIEYFYSNGEYFDIKTVKEISLGESSKEAGMSQLYGFDSLEKITLHAEAYDNYFGSLFGLSKSSSNNEVSLP